MDNKEKPPISVFIITKNEEDRIGKIIKAVLDIADEIIVVDSGSTDKTLEIANALGAQTVHNNWNGYGPQKVFGESLCKNDWILNIDADEEVSPQLAKEIIDLFNQEKEDQCVGYKVKIVNQFFGEKSPKKFAYYYNQLRLYNKEYAGFKDSAIHDSVTLKEGGKIGKFKNIIAHQSFRDFGHWIEKINSYSTMQAKDSFKKGKRPSILKVIITPSFTFFKAYIIRRYFIYGFNGVVYSYVFAFGRMLKLVKTRRLFDSADQ